MGGGLRFSNARLGQRDAAWPRRRTTHEPNRIGHVGHVAQWESARFTREKSLVRSQPCPLKYLLIGSFRPSRSFVHEVLSAPFCPSSALSMLHESGRLERGSSTRGRSCAQREVFEANFPALGQFGGVHCCDQRCRDSGDTSRRAGPQHRTLGGRSPSTAVRSARATTSPQPIAIGRAHVRAPIPSSCRRATRSRSLPSRAGDQQKLTTCR